MKKAIAMRCTKEQFEKIKPKLKGCEISTDITDFNKDPYLVNNGFDKENLILNFSDFNIKFHNREIYETWNENIFLDACGIETEPVYSLTKEQLRSLTDPKVKEWFPEVFKPVLEVGKWYLRGKGKNKDLLVWNGGKNTFGFSIIGDWSDNLTCSVMENYREATEAEVFEALKNEAVKRGFIDGAYFKIDTKLGYHNVLGKFKVENGYLYNNEWRIFYLGQWAEIIPTKTKAEAEKELNCKIVD